MLQLTSQANVTPAPKSQNRKKAEACLGVGSCFVKKCGLEFFLKTSMSNNLWLAKRLFDDVVLTTVPYRIFDSVLPLRGPAAMEHVGLACGLACAGEGVREWLVCVPRYACVLLFCKAQNIQEKQQFFYHVLIVPPTADLHGF